MELWKDIEGYEGRYQVSNEGRVKSLDFVVIRKNGRQHTIKGKILSQYIDDRGYLRCGVGKIHKLVAEAFVSNPNGYRTIHHKDHNKLNNNANNLEWIDETTHNRGHGGQHPCKTVYQYKNGVLIAEYQSAQDAGRKNNIGYGNIARCCRGEQNEYKGFIWSYKPL